MEIYADIKHKVFIEPKHVIEKLIEKEIGANGWIFEKDGKFFRGFEQSAGTHSTDGQAEITKEKYQFVQALIFVLKNI